MIVNNTKFGNILEKIKQATMTEQEIRTFLSVRFPKEDESCDWKAYSNLQNSLCGHEGDDVISYVSAISNMNGGALVIGVEDKTLNVSGIEKFGNYTAESAKARIAEKCQNLPVEKLDVNELQASDSGKIVWLVDIPKHSPRLPVYAHNKAWQRIGDMLTETSAERLDAIRNEIIVADDWSAAIVDDATIDDLDPEAIEKARKMFITRNPAKKDEVATWDDETFLNKSKVTKRGKITRTALILLGKEEAEHLLNPYVMKIRWSLREMGKMANKDYEIFSMPILLSVDRLYNKIRNVKYRLVRPQSLFPDEMMRYDMFNIREPLCNAIAHQDYTQCARIEVVEYEDDHIVFQNHGSFLPPSVEYVVESDCPESVYRNSFLVEAMRNYNMIETEGGGIKKMFVKQKIRFFPLPEYDLSDNKVKATITGKVIDENFARILSANPDLDLADIMLLDRVQKKKAVNDEQAKHLRKQNFIEGRKPNYFLARDVVASTGDRELKSQYVKNKSFDDGYFMDMIEEYLKKFGTATRKDIDNLLKGKLPEVLNEKQKYNKTDNLLRKLKADGTIGLNEMRRWKLM